MAWKKFVRRTSVRERSGTPEIAVWKKGSLAFTKAAEEIFEVRKYRYAILFQDDEETDKIAIKLVNERTNPKEIFSVTPGRSNTVISAKEFFKGIGIKIEKTQRYPLTEEGEYLVFRLSS